MGNPIFRDMLLMARHISFSCSALLFIYKSRGFSERAILFNPHADYLTYKRYVINGVGCVPTYEDEPASSALIVPYAYPNVIA